MFKFKQMIENKLKKKVSAGVIITDGNKMLIGYSGTMYDLPKGGIEEGESPIDAAVRETYEETAYNVDRSNLKDLGRHSYTNEKDLHLFLYVVNILPSINTFKCLSYWTDDKGIKRPEMTRFKYIDLDKREQFLTSNMNKTLDKTNYENLH